MFTELLKALDNFVTHKKKFEIFYFIILFSESGLKCVIVGLGGGGLVSYIHRLLPKVRNSFLFMRKKKAYLFT